MGSGRVFWDTFAHQWLTWRSEDQPIDSRLHRCSFWRRSILGVNPIYFRTPWMTSCFFHFIYWKEKAWWETSNPLVKMETLTGTKHKILQFWCSFPLLSIVTCLLHWRFVSVILGPKQWVCELKQNVTVVISKEIHQSHEGSTTTNVVGKSFTLW